MLLFSFILQILILPNLVDHMAQNMFECFSGLIAADVILIYVGAVEGVLLVLTFAFLGYPGDVFDAVCFFIVSRSIPAILQKRWC